MSNKLQLVGVLNVTPDSFSDGGQFIAPDTAVAQAKRLFADGAAMVDIGAEATNPKASHITVEQEWQRLEPVFAVLLKKYPDFQISLDTRHPEIARRAAKLGKFYINDVTTFNDSDMIVAAVETGYPCIVSHLPSWVHGDIQKAHNAEDKLVDSLQQVKDELLQKRQEMIQAGVNPGNIILDPGIGFGKTPELNRKLVRFAAEPEMQNRNVLIGYSRKRFLGENRFDPAVNLAMGQEAKAAGARYIRVHDVQAHKELISQP